MVSTATSRTPHPTPRPKRDAEPLPSSLARPTISTTHSSPTTFVFESSPPASSRSSLQVPREGKRRGREQVEGEGGGERYGGSGGIDGNGVNGFETLEKGRGVATPSIDSHLERENGHLQESSTSTTSSEVPAGLIQLLGLALTTDNRTTTPPAGRASIISCAGSLHSDYRSEGKRDTLRSITSVQYAQAFQYYSPTESIVEEGEWDRTPTTGTRGLPEGRLSNEDRLPMPFSIPPNLPRPSVLPRTSYTYETIRHSSSPFQPPSNLHLNLDKSLPRFPSLSKPLPPTQTIASTYLVIGLSSDPHSWVTVDSKKGTMGPPHSPGAVEGFWRPQVLGCVRTGDASVWDMGRLDQRMEGREGRRDGEEVERIQAKVSKMAFNRDVEIVESLSEPPSKLAFSAFETTTTSSPIPSTHHVACLTVWVQLDEIKSAAIRSTLRTGENGVEAGVRIAREAAAAGRRFGDQLSSQMKGKEGGGRVGKIEVELAREEGGGPSSTSYWTPFALCLVSHAPIYSILGDLVRISWARHHQDIAKFSNSMRDVLHLPFPRLGEKISIPIDAKKGTFLVASIPTLEDPLSFVRELPLWPLFEALDASNLLLIARVAMSPSGRVVFVSRHPFMVSVATVTFSYILQRRGWRGLVHCSVHSRDLPLYIEDPGPYLLGVPYEMRQLVLDLIPPDVAIVDLDSNTVLIRSQYLPKAWGSSRSRKERRMLEGAIGKEEGPFGVPCLVMEAFPGGRFHSLSEVRGRGTGTDRLSPPAAWTWDQDRVLTTFDKILSRPLRPSLLSRLLHPESDHPNIQSFIESTTQMIRYQTARFVDERDALESRIDRLYLTIGVGLEGLKEWEKVLGTTRTFVDRMVGVSLDPTSRSTTDSRSEAEYSIEARGAGPEQLQPTPSSQSRLDHLISSLHSIVHDSDAGQFYEAVDRRIDAVSSWDDKPPPSSLTSPRQRPIYTTYREGDGSREEDIKRRVGKLAVDATLRSIQSRLSALLSELPPSESASPFPLPSKSASSTLTHDSPCTPSPPGSFSTPPSLFYSPPLLPSPPQLPGQPRRFTPKPLQLPRAPTPDQSFPSRRPSDPSLVTSRGVGKRDSLGLGLVALGAGGVVSGRAFSRNSTYETDDDSYFSVESSRTSMEELEELEEEEPEQVVEIFTRARRGSAGSRSIEWSGIEVVNPWGAGRRPGSSATLRPGRIEG